MNITIQYDGCYPSLCSGNLIVIIDDIIYNFPKNCLRSTGYITGDWETVIDGEWEITEWPENFPEELKQNVLYKINEEIQHGCCGGCI